ncbi:MAG: hypothetical protein ACOZNI_19840 [Myxococcota bacterium]
MSRTLVLLWIASAHAASQTSPRYECDNDYGDSGTWCGGNTIRGTWAYVESSDDSFYYNDARVTSDPYAAYVWEYTSMATIYVGEVHFLVWIPESEYATGAAQYGYGCEEPDGDWWGGTYGLRQEDYRGQWVEIGAIGEVWNGIAKNSRCTIDIYGSIFDAEGETVVADYTILQVRYDPNDPENQ